MNKKEFIHPGIIKKGKGWEEMSGIQIDTRELVTMRIRGSDIEEAYRKEIIHQSMTSNLGSKAHHLLPATL